MQEQGCGAQVVDGQWQVRVQVGVLSDVVDHGQQVAEFGVDQVGVGVG
ncbi:hypothetical protein [Saccharothrix lopnurensis]